MFALAVDYTIHVSDLAMIGGAILTAVKIAVTMRDGLRDVVSAVGGLKQKVEHLESRQEVHHEWFLSNGYNRRQGERRHDASR